jgi:hypothetical protein
MIEQRLSMAIPAAITMPIETVSQEIETQKSRVMARTGFSVQETVIFS